MIIKCDFCGSKFSHLKMNCKSCPNCGGSISDETLLKIRQDEEETKKLKAMAVQVSEERNSIDRELIKQNKKADVASAEKVMSFKHKLISFKKVASFFMVLTWAVYLYFFSVKEADKIALWVGFFVAAFCTGYSLITRRKYFSKLLAYDGSTIGIVGDYFKRVNREGETEYIPTFKINVNGLSYEGLGYETSHKYIAGDPVFISYNPKLPSEMIPIKDRGPRARFNFAELGSVLIRAITLYLAFSSLF